MHIWHCPSQSEKPSLMVQLQFQSKLSTNAVEMKKSAIFIWKLGSTSKAKLRIDFKPTFALPSIPRQEFLELLEHENPNKIHTQMIWIEVGVLGFKKKFCSFVVLTSSLLKHLFIEAISDRIAVRQERTWKGSLVRWKDEALKEAGLISG